MSLQRVTVRRATAGSAFVVVGTLAVIVGLGGAQGHQRPEAAAAAVAHHGTSGPNAEIIERGRYLVAITGCGDCHTPMKMGPDGPEPDLTRLFAGHPQDLLMPAPPPLKEGPWIGYLSTTNTAFAGPWGVTYATNMTPDMKTGMGLWTDIMFIKSMKEGKHMGVSRPIMPPMPWPAYAQMTDDDLRAMFEYLKTIPAIENRVPAYAPPG